MGASTLCSSTLQTRFLDLLNGMRRRNGLPSLAVDATLQKAAEFRASDMVARNYFSHDTPGHGSARDVLEEFGYDAELTGENICWGEKTAEEAFDTWATSQDHLNNMLSPHYTAIGIGGPVGTQFQDSKWGLWVTPFGSALTTPIESCSPDGVVETERPDKPPRRLRLPRQRPPREVHRRHRRGDEDRDLGAGRGQSETPVGATATATGDATTPPSDEPDATGDPVGPILTQAPWGSFGIGWEEVNRWDDVIERAASETGVPAERIKAHIVIESSGQPDAIQKNDANGWSFGLMQVVPRWWRSTILELAGRSDTGQSEREVGQLLLDDPALAVRAGAAVLQTFFDGDWDRASSRFFLGNPDWNGHDFVNLLLGQQYKAMLDGLIEEIVAARDLGAILSRPDGPEPEVAAGPVQFGRVPHPPFEDRLIPDDNNIAWDGNLGQRRVRGVVLHRQQGRNRGTDGYFRSLPPGGAAACPQNPNDPTYFNWGGCRGLTDYGVDHETGEILRWNDPTGAAHPGVSPNRVAWASGPVLNPFGDGKAFLDDNPGDPHVVNRDQVSVELSGTYHEPIFGNGVDQPVGEKGRDAAAALIAYFADQFQIPYHQFPFVPGKDYSFVRWHHEFTRGTGKFCPGKDVMAATDDIFARARAIMKKHQTAAVPVADREFDLVATATPATNGAEDLSVPAGAVAGSGTEECPADYPIKGNAQSGIYHVPGGGSYHQTIPEFCFATADAAEEAGFRAAKH